MSDDGADMGITAGRALKTVLGGELSPSPDEGMTPQKMVAYLESAPLAPEDYDDAGRACGRIVLEYLRAHSEDAMLPADGKYTWDPETGDTIQLVAGMYEQMGKKAPNLFESLDGELTGFLFGWGVNAAKYALDLPPVPNPAIVTIG